MMTIATIQAKKKFVVSSMPKACSIEIVGASVGWEEPLLTRLRTEQIP